MKKRLWLLILPLALTACCPKPGVVKYCPPPVKPMLQNPQTVPALLGNYNKLGTYSLQLESVVKCYEGVEK